MSFDIYGERLRPGHCEVHPHVHEEYPCSLCMEKSRSKPHIYISSVERGMTKTRISDRDKAIWRAALTLANNVCVQESDRARDDDGDTGWINGTAECARRIRGYVDPGDSHLADMFAEADVPESAE